MIEEWGILCRSIWERIVHPVGLDVVKQKLKLADREGAAVKFFKWFKEF